MANYKTIIDLYFSTIRGVDNYKPNEVGFTYTKKGQVVSVFTEACSLSTFFAIPFKEQSKPSSISIAETDLYCIVFPEQNLIAMGQVKKIKFWLKTSRSQWATLTDGDIEYACMNRKALNSCFEFVYDL
jgi:hypothetical protein